MPATIRQTPPEFAPAITTDRSWPRPLLAVLFVAILAVGLFLITAGQGVADNRLLVVDDAGTVSLLDTATGEAGYRVADAVPTPDRSTLLSTGRQADQTILSSHDSADGQVTGTTVLPHPNLSIRTVSPRGGAVALLPGEVEGGLYLPEPRARTQLTVAYTDDRPSRTYDLAGNIVPEMFSLAEDALFVLSFDPPMAPNGYSVQRLDLSTGELADTASPQVGLNPKMAGQARAQVMHPDGTFLYTLYTMASDPVPAPDTAQDRWAFIHVINLDEQWSYCIFLDHPVGTGDEAAIGMGISPDGRSVYVADSATSTLTQVDTPSLTAQPPTVLPELRPGPGATGTVTVAEDGTLYVSSGTIAVQVAPDLGEVQSAWFFDTPVEGLATHGNELRVAVAGRVVLMDRLTGEETGTLRAPGQGALHLLGPPTGSATSIPVDCVC